MTKQVQDHVERQLAELRQELNDNNAVIRDLTKQIHGFTEIVTKVVTENRFRDEKIERLEDSNADQNKRLQSLENTRAGNAVKWTILGIIGVGAIGAIWSFITMVIRPLLMITERLQ